MGIVKRQSIKQSIVLYTGIFIGVFSNIFIYPLDTATYGLIRFLMSTSLLMYPILSLGVITLSVRFFPTFNDDPKRQHGFLGLLLLTSFIATLFVGSLLLYGRHAFYEALDWMDINKATFSENILEIGLICILMTINGILAAYISNFKRIVVPAIANQLLLKIGIPVVMLCTYFLFWENALVKTALIGIYAVASLLLCSYAIHLGVFHLKPNFRFLNKKLSKQMASYALLSILGSLGYAMALRLDTIMVASITDFSKAGVYDIAGNIANVVATPYSAFVGIISPFISTHSHENNYSEIAKIYKTSSLTLLILGFIIFISIWISVEDLLQLTKQDEIIQIGKGIILLLAIGKLVDMATGVNQQIIAFSKYYYVNLILLLGLGVLNIYLNQYLIPIHGITGAAIATFISVSMYNILKFLFVWYKFKMQPFTINHLWVLLCALLAYGIGYIMPDTGYILTNIILHSGTTALIFGGLVIYFDFSPDITKLFYQAIARGRKFIGR